MALPAIPLGFLTDENNNPISDTNPQPAGITQSSIIVPTDQQTILKSQVALSTTNINAGATQTTASINCATSKYLGGKLFMDQAGTISFLLSDDGVTWDTDTTMNITTTASSPKVWGPVYIPTPYCEISVKNTGAIATTVVRNSAYQHPV